MRDLPGSIEGRSILITGGAGTIGSNLARAAVGLGVQRVVILDDLSSSFAWNVPDLPAVLFLRGSVTDDGDLERAFAGRPEVVFHLAALFANQKSVDFPERDLHVNGLGVLKTLEHASRAGVQRFVYASSGCSVYGSDHPLPLREEYVSLHLSTPYQITKMLGELYANYFHGRYGLPIVNVRLFNVYGPGEVPGRYRNVIANFFYWALRGQPLPITGDPLATRDFTFVGDAVDGLLRAALSPYAVGEAVNLASGREIVVRDLAEAVNAMTSNAAGIRITERRDWDTKPRLLASIEKAGRLLGYAPSSSFEDGLAATLAWFRARWPEIERDALFTPAPPQTSTVERV